MSQCNDPYEPCRDKIKVKCLRIPKTKLTQFNPNEKKYWKGVIRQVEQLAREKGKKDRIRRYDLSTSLPPVLYKRVARIIPLIPIEEDIFEEEIREVSEDEVYAVKTGEKNLSELTEILQKEKEFFPIELKMEPKIDRHQRNKKSSSWTSEYICKRRKERIKWQSKIYNLEKNISEKPLYDQAEFLMDAAAERFTEWVNGLSDNPDTNISKDMLKKLFSLESGAGPLAGIHIEPKQVKAVPDAVAQSWNLPEKSLELKLQNQLKLRKEKEHIPQPSLVAFGKTLPMELRKWRPLDADTVVEPVFPTDLLTRKTIFQGIGHLRSTQALIAFYKRHKNLDRPQYLVERGHFDTKEKKVHKEEVPFYELV